MTEEMIRYYAGQAAEYDQQYEYPRFQNDLRAIRNMSLMFLQAGGCMRSLVGQAAGHSI